MKSCPFAEGLHCSVDANPERALSSRCAGCPYIDDVDRNLIIYEVRRHSRRHPVEIRPGVIVRSVYREDLDRQDPPMLLVADDGVAA